MSIRVTPLRHGSLQLDKDLLLSGHPGMILTRSHRDRPRVLCEAPIITYVIEHPEGRVLFDAAISTDWRQTWPEGYQEAAWYDDTDPEQYFETTLKRCGLAPDDFRYVVLSHLHCDHAGNARLFARANNVEVLAHENEIKGALSLEEDQEFFLRGDYDVPGLKLVGVYGDRQILPGIHLMEVPGHTWGTMALVVEADAGPLILTSDSCYTQDSYGPPAIPSIISMDKERWAASIEKIRRRAERIGARVLFGHDTQCVAHREGGPALEPVRFGPGAGY